MPRCLGASGLVRASHEESVGVMGAAGPDFLPGNHEVVPVLDGPGLEGCEIGAGARLAESLAPVDPALGDGRQVLALLLLRAVHHQRRSEHADAEGVFARGPVVGHLLVEDELGNGRCVLTAVLLGPAHG